MATRVIVIRNPKGWRSAQSPKAHDAEGCPREEEHDHDEGYELFQGTPLSYLIEFAVTFI